MPVEILHPRDYLPTSSFEQSQVIEKFVAGLESALHVKRTPISITELWKEDTPDGPEHANVVEYLETVGNPLL